MPWVVGIDEAGYGPNLGPLVQAVAGRAEELRPVARRNRRGDDLRHRPDPAHEPGGVSGSRNRSWPHAKDAKG